MHQVIGTMVISWMTNSMATRAYITGKMATSMKERGKMESATALAFFAQQMVVSNIPNMKTVWVRGRVCGGVPIVKLPNLCSMGRKRWKC